MTVPEAAVLRAAGKDIRTDSRPATAQEAANWVEYVNGDQSTPYGAMRAKHGHPEPFGAVYWGDRQRDLGRLGAGTLGRPPPTLQTRGATSGR